MSQISAVNETSPGRLDHWIARRGVRTPPPGASGRVATGLRRGGRSPDLRPKGRKRPADASRSAGAGRQRALPGQPVVGHHRTSQAHLGGGAHHQPGPAVGLLGRAPPGRRPIQRLVAQAQGCSRSQRRREARHRRSSAAGLSESVPDHHSHGGLGVWGRLGRRLSVTSSRVPRTMGTWPRRSRRPRPAWWRGMPCSLLQARPPCSLLQARTGAHRHPPVQRVVGGQLGLGSPAGGGLGAGEPGARPPRAARGLGGGRVGIGVEPAVGPYPPQQGKVAGRQFVGQPQGQLEPIGARIEDQPGPVGAGARPPPPPTGPCGPSAAYTAARKASSGPRGSVMFMRGVLHRCPPSTPVASFFWGGHPS